MATQYRTVSKEEYEKWRDSNPGKIGLVNGQEVQNPYPEAQDLGTIGNLLRDISKPFRYAASMPKYIATGNIENKLLTPEEEYLWQEDPLKSGGKSIAGLLSWLIPGGAAAKSTTTAGKIGSAAVRGAVQGTLGGYGASKEGSELESTLKGAGLGGLIGGATQGISEGLGSLSKRVANRTKTISDQNVKNLGISSKTIKDLNGLQNAKDSASVFYNTADELGLPISTRYQRSDALNTMLSNYGDEVATGLNNSNATISTKNIINAIDNSSKLKIAGLDESNFINSIKQVLSNYGDDVSAPVAKDIISQLDDLAGGFNKISGDVSGQRNTILKEIRNIVRTELGNAVPEINSALAAQSSLLDIADDIYSQAGKTTTVKIPILGINVSGSTGISKIADKLANATAQKTTSGGVLPNLISGIDKLSGLTQKVTPAIISTVAGMNNIQPSTSTNSITSSTGTGSTSGANINKLALAQAVLNGDISTSDANFLIELLGGGTSSTDQTITTGLTILDQIEQQLNDLNLANTSVGGKITGTARNIATTVGGSPDVEVYNDLLESYAVPLARAIGETGVLSDQDKEAIMSALPKITDSKEKAQEKLNSFRNLIYARMGTSSTSSSTSDYDYLLNLLGQ